MCHTNHRAYLALAFAFLLGGPPARADMPIEVSVECKVEGIKVKYTKQEYGRVVDKLRFALREELGGPSVGPPNWPDFVLWKFVQGSSQDLRAPRNGHTAPLLQFTIFEPQYPKNKINLRMTYLSSEDYKSWGDETWIQPGQLYVDNYPKDPDVLAGELFDFIRNKFLVPHAEELRRLFVNSAPLAEGGIWDSDPVDLRLVLPLPWDRFGLLSRKEFRVAGSWPEKADERPTAPKGRRITGKTSSREIELLSCGTGRRGNYSVNNQRAYDAISVAPRAWRASRNEDPQPIDGIRKTARQLRPLRSYLTEDLPKLCADMETIP